jgi:hypothetical protein
MEARPGDSAHRFCLVFGNSGTIIIITLQHTRIFFSAEGVVVEIVIFMNDTSLLCAIIIIPRAAFRLARPTLL